ncbi:hypothetical protein NX10_25755 [Pseudomonas fluorescens]|nr:hypothetical protein NX10_25755 [Pseudomonas fluorescens]
MKAAAAFAAVVNTGEVAVGVVVVATLEQVFVPLTDAVSMQLYLFIVLVLAEQQALLALLLATGAELLAGQARAVEVAAAELPAIGSHRSKSKSSLDLIQCRPSIIIKAGIRTAMEV